MRWTLVIDVICWATFLAGCAIFAYFLLIGRETIPSPLAGIAVGLVSVSWLVFLVRLFRNARRP